MQFFLLYQYLQAYPETSFGEFQGYISQYPQPIFLCINQFSYFFNLFFCIVVVWCYSVSNRQISYVIKWRNSLSKKYSIAYVSLRLYLDSQIFYLFFLFFLFSNFVSRCVLTFFLLRFTVNFLLVDYFFISFLWPLKIFPFPWKMFLLLLLILLVPFLIFAIYSFNC